MAVSAFKGTITTTGASDAIRLDKALFRQNPEFRQKARVEAHVIGHGTMLVQVVEEDAASPEEGDPLVFAFLSFIESTSTLDPSIIEAFSQRQKDRSLALTEGVDVSDDDSLPDDVSF